MTKPTMEQITRIRNTVDGVQCTQCNGYPTHLKWFAHMRELMTKCECGNYAPRKPEAYQVILTNEEL